MSIRQFHLSNYDMFSLLECIGIKNICVHLGIFTATCNLSKISDLTNQIMIPESGIIDEQHQNKVYRLLAFFSPLGHAWLILLADFLYRLTPLGCLFAGCYHISTLVSNQWGLSMSPCITVYGIISPHSTWVPVCRLLPHFHIGFKPMGTEYESMYYSVWDNKNHIIVREHPSLLKPQVWC